MKRETFLFCVLIIVIAFSIYYPILGNSLLDFWDDQWVVMNAYTENGLSWENLWLILTSFYHGQYAPFNEYLYLFLYSAVDYNAFYFHLSSLLLHIANAILVYFVLKKLLSLSPYKENLTLKYLPQMTSL